MAFQWPKIARHRCSRCGAIVVFLAQHRVFCGYKRQGLGGAFLMRKFCDGGTGAYSCTFPCFLWLFPAMLWYSICSRMCAWCVYPVLGPSHQGKWLHQYIYYLMRNFPPFILPLLLPLAGSCCSMALDILLYVYIMHPHNIGAIGLLYMVSTLYFLFISIKFALKQEWGLPQHFIQLFLASKLCQILCGMSTQYLHEVLCHSSHSRWCPIIFCICFD